MPCGSLNEKLTALHNPIKSDEIKLNQNVLHSSPKKWHLGKHMCIKKVWFQSLWVLPLHGCIQQERNELTFYTSKWQCIKQGSINFWYLLYLVLTDCFKDLKSHSQITDNPNHMQVSLYVFFFPSHKTLVTRGIYSELASTGLYPAHITLPMITFPTCRHLNAKQEMHSTGESRLECLFRNQHLGKEKTHKHFA